MHETELRYAMLLSTATAMPLGLRTDRQALTDANMS